MTVAEASTRWGDVCRGLSIPVDVSIFSDALQLLVNQGEMFSSSGIIFLRPDYVTQLLKPLVDHRLAQSVFRKQLLANYAEAHAASTHKAAALLPAIDCLVKSGELREELLPMLWEPLGLHGDDYGAVLLMLCASGVLFLAEHTEHDRRWVMPMRLSETQPPDAKERWNEEGRKAESETLSIAYRLGRIAPPGITERLMASCYGFGKYHRFWKRGALITTSLTSASAKLLIELKSRPSGGVTSAKVEHELNLEMRGARTSRAEHWAVLLQARKLASLVLDDFPGLPLSCELACPGCLNSAEHRSTPTKWAADEATTRALRCELCAESVNLQLVKENSVPPPEPLSLSLHLAPDEVRSFELKFVAEQLRFGKPIETSLGLAKLLGVADEEHMSRLLLAGETAITDEIAAHGATQTDEYGWTVRAAKLEPATAVRCANAVSMNQLQY